MSDQFKIIKTGNSYLLYDADIIAAPTTQLFDADYHTNSETQQKISPPADIVSSGSGVGRARVIYFNYVNPSDPGAAIPMILKHYYRGGMVARLIRDRYLGVDVENSRAFKEWRLLKTMHSLQLPVPVAVAASVERGPFYYRADLITCEIENAKTLADILSAGSLETERWKKIGVCIKRFHQHDIFHADLNARNIMLRGDDEVFLIDFDNSYIRRGSDSWKSANLSRLNRSLMKFSRNMKTFNFVAADWDALVQGYGDNAS